MAAKVLGKIDWDAIDTKLPQAQTPSGQEARRALFNKIDFSGNGLLTLTEIQGSLPELVKKDLKCLERRDNFRAAVKCAFNAARDVDDDKDIGKQDILSQRKTKIKQSDMVGRSEFHALLVAFRYYLELDIVFGEMDRSGNRMLSYNECKASLSILEEWGIDQKMLRAKFPGDQWAESMKFEQFAEWCIVKRFRELELVLDDNDPEDTVREAAGRIQNQREMESGKMLASFQSWDVDGDGKIREEELASILKVLDPDFTDEQAHVLFVAADTNGDGGIDFAEFAQWILTE